MNDKYYQYIENRLREWAEWFRKDIDGLGYPSTSIEYFLMKQEIRSEKRSPGYIKINEEAEEIEELVREMAEYNINMAHALRLHYFRSGGLRIKSKELKISHMLYKSYLEMAQQWLAGRLSISYKKF